MDPYVDSGRIALTVFIHFWNQRHGDKVTKKLICLCQEDINNPFNLYRAF